jgi:23S rRNA pseudouridine2605 synthase
MSTESPDSYRLNKYIAHSGLCSRRQAAEWVKKGLIEVNGVVESNPGTIVGPKDVVKYKGEQLSPETVKVYLLMNKPKDVLTTAKDDRGRKTVLDMLKGKVEQRVYPVGRLDRNTTGLLILTNDGDLAKKLAHPSFEVKKIYHAFLDKEVTDEDLEKLRKGLVLDDGPIVPDKINRVQGAGLNEIGVEIHSGRNRIVRRMFESLGYRVIKLDRVYFAGLTKKDLPRGRTRHLTEREVIMLKHFV